MGIPNILKYVSKKLPMILAATTIIIIIIMAATLLHVIYVPGTSLTISHRIPF